MRTRLMENHYSVLEVSETASNEQIKQAYLRMVKNYHPDKIPAGTPEMMKRDAKEKFIRIRQAYEVLSGSERFQYDFWLETLRNGQHQTTPSNSARQTPPPSAYSPPTEPSSKHSVPWKIGTVIRGIRATWRHADSFVRRNSVAIFLFFVAGLPAAILIPQWGNADGKGWDPDTCGSTFALLSVAVVVTLLFFRRVIRWTAATHPKIGFVGLELLLLAMISIAVGSNNPSRRPAPKPTQADLIAPLFLKRHFDTANPVGEISERFEARQDKEPPAEAGWPDMPVTGGYHGSVHNLTANVQANFGIFIEQYRQTLRGCMSVQKPLFGSGPLVGSMKGPFIQFTVTNPAFRIVFEGARNGNQLMGTYRVIPPSGKAQLGEFSLDKTDDDKLAISFDPTKNCPTDADIDR